MGADRVRQSVAVAAACCGMIIIAGCGDDARPPASVGGSGAMDGGAAIDGGGMGAVDGGAGTPGFGGMGGSSGAGGMPDGGPGGAGAGGSDDDGGVEDAGRPSPVGWVCRGSLWLDGVCDCGCGLYDGDCPGPATSCAAPGCTASSCEACFAVNGTWVPCNPPAWTCDEAKRDDAQDICDCGCGAPDPDCGGRGCTGASCRTRACERCHDDQGAVIGCAVPIGWQCTLESYGGGDGCDCGCGAPDPDCGVGGCTDGRCDDAACDTCHDFGGRDYPCGLPDAWQCSRAAYGTGNGCDCGCGADDPDCGNGGCAGNSCNDAACETCHFDSVSVSCALPQAWTCHPGFYDANGVCDCGCGAPDPDCGGGGCTTVGCNAAACDLCHEPPDVWSSCGTWTCATERQGAGDACDCGCGATDPDCLWLPSCTEPGCSVDTCNFCNDGGTSVACGGWTCSLDRYGDGFCDCGCGAADPDCEGTGCTERGCKATGCMQCRDMAGGLVPCVVDSVCGARIGSGDGCDCGCGVVDPDCGQFAGCSQPGCTQVSCVRCYDPSGREIQCGGLL